MKALSKFRMTTPFRKALILVVLALIWEGYTRLFNVEPLLFPSFSATMAALFESLVNGPLLQRVLASLSLLLQGYLLGTALAFALTLMAVSSRLGNELLSTLAAMFNPLPAIALLPLGMLWFGLGPGGILFVLIHSVVWPVALNTHSGFQSVNQTLRLVGRNFGLTGFGFVTGILIPAALPAIITGLKIGWSFGWRTLIAAELIFGATQEGGGLGWFIFENKNELQIAHVFAGLITVTLIGIAVENFVFRPLEKNTIEKWGMV